MNRVDSLQIAWTPVCSQAYRIIRYGLRTVLGILLMLSIRPPLERILSLERGSQEGGSRRWKPEGPRATVVLCTWNNNMPWQQSSRVLLRTEFGRSNDEKGVSGRCQFEEAGASAQSRYIDMPSMPEVRVNMRQCCRTFNAERC